MWEYRYIEKKYVLLPSILTKVRVEEEFFSLYTHIAYKRSEKISFLGRANKFFGICPQSELV